MSGYGGDGAHARLPDLTGDAAATARELLDLAVDAAGIGTFDWDLVTGTLNWTPVSSSCSATTRTASTAASRRSPPACTPTTPSGSACSSRRRSTGPGSAPPSTGSSCPAGSSGGWRPAGGRWPGEDGAAVRLLGAAWDISVRRQAQDRLAQLVDSMAVGFIAMDPDWVMTHVNAEAERITGTPRARLLGRSLWEAFPAGVGSVFERNYRRAAETGRPVVFEASYPEPLDIWVEVRAVPSAEGMALYFLDITARRRARELAEQAAERERLLSRITEELSATLDAGEAARRLTPTGGARHRRLVHGHPHPRRGGQRRQARAAQGHLLAP
jgi:PAS domain S-box-containing protein